MIHHQIVEHLAAVADGTRGAEPGSDAAHIFVVVCTLLACLDEEGGIVDREGLTKLATLCARFTLIDLQHTWRGLG